MSRNLLLTIEVQWRITDAIRNGHTLAAAAEAAGIGPRTLSRWLSEGRKHRSGKFKRLVLAVEAARIELRSELDTFDIETLRDKSLPIAARQRAAHSIRARVFGGNDRPGHTAVDVYHHHEVTVDASRRPEEPPRAIVGDERLTGADVGALHELLAILERLRETVPEDTPQLDVIEAVDEQDETPGDVQLP